jgi:anti-sigma regulatory factor (Ser/Thr protein kinase)
MKVETPQSPRAPSGHAVQFYEHDPELARVVAGYLAGGLAEGAAAIAIATPDHRQRFADELAAAGIDVESATRERMLVMLDADETLSRFTIAGRLDADTFDHVIGGVIRAARSGGRPVRAYGEMVALLWDVGDVTGAIELEDLWSELRSRIEFSLLCGYTSTSFQRPDDADALRHLCRLHTAVRGAAPTPAVGDTPVWIARDFPPDVEAPGQARRFVGRAIRQWGLADPLRDDAELVVSELATNAVVHARSGFRVLASLGRSELRLSVQDASRARPAIRAAGPWAGLGLGLPTVDAIAAEWGVERIAEGKIVWAELSLPERTG